MEPVTHILTGACLARSGLNRRAAYATLTMAVAAEFPDIDTLWSLRGPVESFQHHRGITHTFVGLPFEAAFLVGAVWLLHRYRLRRHLRSAGAAAPLGAANPLRAARPLTAAPVRWGLLYAFTLLALLSHLLLDFTNNYGLRPFFPFNPRWYAASITFIFDPWMFLLLLGPVALPPLFRLVSSEVGARRQPFAARGWAVAALVGVVLLWGWRWVEHARAVALFAAESVEAPQRTSTAPGTLDEPPIPAPLTDAQADLNQQLAPTPAAPVYVQPLRVLASPDPLNPFHWSAVGDFGDFYWRGEVDALRGTVTRAQNAVFKPEPSPPLQAAEASPLGRAYLDWSPMPFLSLEQGSAAGNALPDPAGMPPALSQTVVTFRDPRFMGNIPLMNGSSGRTPLTGTVVLDGAHRVLQQAMDGRAEH